MKLALWDLDGTLSDDSARQFHYQAHEWDQYFSYEAQMADPVFPEARALYRRLKASGWTMGYLTARLERNRPATVDWLRLHGFDDPESVILRSEADRLVRPPRFKSAVVESFIATGNWEEVLLIDNDRLVVERITEHLGAHRVFHATWSVQPEPPPAVTVLT